LNDIVSSRITGGSKTRASRLWTRTFDITNTFVCSTKTGVFTTTTHGTFESRLSIKRGKTGISPSSDESTANMSDKNKEYDSEKNPGVHF